MCGKITDNKQMKEYFHERILYGNSKVYSRQNNVKNFTNAINK